MLLQTIMLYCVCGLTARQENACNDTVKFAYGDTCHSSVLSHLKNAKSKMIIFCLSKMNHLIRDCKLLVTKSLFLKGMGGTVGCLIKLLRVQMKLRNEVLILEWRSKCKLVDKITLYKGIGHLVWINSCWFSCIRSRYSGCAQSGKDRVQRKLTNLCLKLRDFAYWKYSFILLLIGIFCCVCDRNLTCINLYQWCKQTLLGDDVSKSYPFVNFLGTNGLVEKDLRNDTCLTL